MNDLQAALDRLEAVGLVHRATEFPDLEYWFRHALVQDAAYASLLKRDRQRLHAQVGTVLEQDYAAHPRLLAPILATHFLAARAPVRALRTLRA